MNNKKQTFILPKMQKVQKNDLISILSLQPKSVSELEQYRLTEFNTNSLSKTSSSINNNNNNNNNNDFLK
jgi:hypothetical protein